MATTAKKDAKTPTSISAEDFVKINTEYDAQETKSSHVSSVRKMILERGEALGLHAEAFKLGRKLGKMNAGSRADFLRGFDLYRQKDFLDLDAQGDMVDEAKARSREAEEKGVDGVA